MGSYNPKNIFGHYDYKGFMKFVKPRILISLTLLMLFFNPLNGQNSDNYEYLIACFKNSNIDTSDREIKGIGKVQIISLESHELEETGLAYYEIPVKKRDKAVSKLTRIAANQYIETWKNNSRIEQYEKFAIGESSIVDLRLHILIENIYVQIIFICDEKTLYEIICFRDINDETHFNALSKKVKDKSCL